MTLERWSRLSEWPLVVAALLFLMAYSVQVVAAPSGAQLDWTEAIVWITWAVFFADYAVKLALAQSRARWFMRNLHELAILALPALRPLRLLRLVLLLRVMHRTAGSRLRGRIATFVAGAAVILAYCGALAVLDAEQNAEGANITSFGDALWWALATITTVGYGDHYPVTVVGRLVAAGLMLSGIAVLGAVTASMASWLVEAVSRETAAVVETGNEEIEHTMARLTAHVARLEAELAERNGSGASG
ncbi:potassium channel family protein [Sinomonas halotolerans]|uniref:Potassium channel family protein n=1 Tax=Sinomonas halotolerans TaxID=1644133 RepID=A0ABU9X2R2_9MICC